MYLEGVYNGPDDIYSLNPIHCNNISGDTDGYGGGSIVSDDDQKEKRSGLDLQKLQEGGKIVFFGDPDTIPKVDILKVQPMDRYPDLLRKKAQEAKK